MIDIGYFINHRSCEICGETAENVSGVTNYGFMEKWNERRFMDDDGNSSNRFGGCWRGQPFCNFLMACLMPCNSICSAMVFPCKYVLAGESTSIILAFNSSYSQSIVSG